MDISTRLEQMLGQMRSAQALVASKAAKAAPEAAATKADFAAVLRASIDQVNKVQQHAEGAVQAFEVGKPGVELHDVMLSVSKANISFQQMVQVRNRLVSAYHDIMNMQV